jgi:hypothetical protein
MDPKYDETGDDLDQTVRNLRTLSERPGELSFRQNIASAFDKVNDRLGKIEVRLARIDERQINRTTVAEIVRKEIEPIQRDVTTQGRIIWGLAGASGTALVVLAIAKLFGHG